MTVRSRATVIAAAVLALASALPVAGPSGLPGGAAGPVLGAPSALAAVRRKAPVLPKWDLSRSDDLNLDVDVGFASLAGTYDVAFEGRTGTIGLSYAADASQVGGTLLLDDFTFLGLTGTWSVTGGVQTVVLQDAVRRPSLQFTGTVDGDGRDLTGTYTRKTGYLGLPGAGGGPMTFDRTAPVEVPGTWDLRLRPTMDRRGIVKGALGTDGKETRVRLAAYGGRTFDGGLLRGRVRTSRADGTTTTAVLTVRGVKDRKAWTIRMAGPVTADGFQALADIRAGGFVARGVPVVLPVIPGPEPPPPPPPPPPRNLLSGGIARVVGNQIQITRDRAPSRFFGVVSDVHVEFPSTDALQTVHADPASAGGAAPRRFYAEVGARVYGTATAPADVTLEIRRFSMIRGGVVEVLCTGRAYAPTGASKPVNVLLQAVVE